MTFRQVLAALWRRKWIVVAITVLAAVVAAGYLAREDPNYESVTEARLSAFMTDSVEAGQISGVTVDIDPTIITTPTILDPVAESLDLPEGALRGAVSHETIEGTRTTQLRITAAAPTAQLSREIADAVVASYSAYLEASVASTLETLHVRLQDATAQAQTYQQQVAANPDDTIAATNLSSALATIGSLNSQIAELQNAGPPLTVTRPAAPGESTNPGSLLVAAVALLSGLIAGAGIALIRDRFDDRVRADDDIEALTGVPAIAELANDRRVARKKLSLPAASAERTALSEGLRSLRTTAQVLLPDGKGAVVVTSVEPGDGKTFVSANLALSWARAGRKVILVGGDLRRPQLGTYFEGIEDGEGLGGLLSDAAENGRAPNQGQIGDALRSTSYRGLRVLPAGQHDGEPADLLAGPHLGRIVTFLARGADVVVIDSPPALALADASELASHSVGVILLATVNRTRRALLRDTVDSLRSNGIDVLGIVVNRSLRKLPKSYSSYYVGGASGRRPPVSPEPARRAVSQPLENDAELLAIDEGADNARTSLERGSRESREDQVSMSTADVTAADDSASGADDDVNEAEDDDVDEAEDHDASEFEDDASEAEDAASEFEDAAGEFEDDAGEFEDDAGEFEDDQEAELSFDNDELGTTAGGLRRDSRRKTGEIPVGTDQDQPA